MSNVAKLKKQAAEHEQKQQIDKALAIYIKLLENFDENAAELDVGLFNRVGDMQLRLGNVADAVDYYERAADRYADIRLWDNAIALCKKILRQSPGRSSIYYKLGKAYALKQFKADAKQNFLEYADRMQRSGNVDEAFRALGEFADLCPDQDDVRLMLADQLARAGRRDDALEQLQILHQRYDADGRSGEATATVERMRAIDPAAQPRSGGGQRKAVMDDLVFIDLNDSPRPSRAMAAIADPPRPVPPPAAPPGEIAAPVIERASVADVDLIELDAPTTAAPLGGITRVDDGAVSLDSVADAGSLLGLESTSLVEPNAPPPPAASGLEFEPTSFGGPPPPIDPAQRADSVPIPSTIDGEGDDFEFLVPSEDMERASDDIQLILPDAPAAATDIPETPAATEGLLDLDLAMSAPVTAPPPAPRQGAPIPMLSLDDDFATGPAIEAPQALTEPLASSSRQSTIMAAQSVEILLAAVEGEPDDWGLRRELGEAMLEAGDRAGGIAHLEAAMAGAESASDLGLAASLAEELARLDPDAVRHHQKRVEYAFRRNDRDRLAEAYLSLGDALLRADQADKARTVYQRVLELSPDDLRARMAIDGLPAPQPVLPSAGGRRSGAQMAAARTPTPVAVPAVAPPAEDFVNLGDWLREDEGPRDTRMVVDEQEPTGDENADFADMLRKFKAGVAENVEAEDYQSHYDLAIAYKEMGLLDEAISEFQRALGSPTNRLPTYEALGQCFIEKGQHKMAASILGRALTEPGATEEKLVGVLYLLGRASESQGRHEDALDYYQRVFVLDITFQDVADRMNAVEEASR